MVFRLYSESEQWLRRGIEVEIHALMSIRNIILKGGEEGKRMALAAIDKTARDLFAPRFGITDYELITGKKPKLSEYMSESKESAILDLYNDIRRVLENEVRQEYGLNLRDYVQDYLDIQTKQIFAGCPYDEVGEMPRRLPVPSTPEFR